MEKPSAKKVFIFFLLGAILIPLIPSYQRYERELEPVERLKIDNEIVTAIVTAYTSSVDETDDTPFITASGAETALNHIACPQRYPFGTEVEMDGEVYICEDRMNPRYWDEDRFDRWFETKEEAFAWGKRELKVTIALK